jgi:hypothetical protein
MRFVVSALVAMGIFVNAARAEGPPQDTTAFEQAYGLSFYVFDACGDGLAGRIWRRALVERFDQCQFSPEARAKFKRRSTAQRVKASKAIQGMIEEHGGLPIRLDGMSQTCREQQDSAPYQTLRSRLEAYDDGAMTSAALITAPCDAGTITP